MSRNERRQEEKYNKKFAEAKQQIEQGIRLQLSGNLAEAEKAYQRVLLQFPEHDAALNCLGVVNIRYGKLDEAEKLLKKAVAVNPRNSGAYGNLGIVESQKNNSEKALEYYAAALELNPHDANLYSNIAMILSGTEKYNEALAYYNHALKINKNNPEVWSGLGNIMQKIGRLEDAITSFRAAITLRPDSLAHSNLLLCMNYSNKFTVQDLFEESQRFAAIHAPEKFIMPAAENDLNPERKIKIGYVSGDFMKHPAAYFIKNTLAHHDKENFEIFCYSTSPIEDDYTKKLRSFADHWTVIANISDDDAARKIRDDKIDILIDLSGHTAKNRLSMIARKPAPIQASWIGYVGTTGMKQMDYIICDEPFTYSGLEKYFTERFMMLDDHITSFDEPDYQADTGDLPAIKNGYVTFGSFNNIIKLSEEAVEVWAKILNAVEGSKLYLKTSALSDEVVKKNYRDMFFRHGITAERLVMAGRSPRDEYFAAYNGMDIALDPFPYNGGTTTMDTLWMGVPVITLAGDKMVGRVGASTMHGGGMPEFVADSQEEYVTKAVALAGDLEKLSGIRKTLRDKLKKSALFDAPLITKNLENKLRQAWQEYCQKTSG